MEISGLEDEYRLCAGKPRLFYTKRTATPEDRLTTFLGMIQAEGVVSYRPFQDAEELGSLVADDLAVLLTERFAGAGAARPAAAASLTTGSAAPAPSSAPLSPAHLPALRWPLIDRVDELKTARRCSSEDAPSSGRPPPGRNRPWRSSAQPVTTAGWPTASALLARVRTGQGQLGEARTLLHEARTVWGTL
jgi:hypothetical protein